MLENEKKGEKLEKITWFLKGQGRIRIRIRIRKFITDPDPDPRDQKNTDPDPDPKHWSCCSSVNTSFATTNNTY